MKLLVHSNYKPQNTGGIEKVVEQLIQCCLEDEESQVDVIFGGKSTYCYRNDRVTLNSLKIIAKIRGMSVLLFGNFRFFMKGIRSDHIIFQSPYPSLWIALILLGLLGKKITVYVHAVPSLPKPFDKLFGFLEWFATKNAQLVFTSEAIRKDYCYGRIDYRRHLIVPLYLDDVAEDYAGDEIILPDRYVLYIGRLANYKGIDNILLSALQLHDVNFVIAGCGDLLSEIERQISELKLSNVMVLGRYVSESEKSFLIKNSSFVVFPSTTKNEAFGIVQLEAMHHKKALINTRLDTGVNFVAPDGICALTVAPNNVPELCHAIERLWENESMASELGLNGHHRLQREFSKEKFCGAWFDIIFGKK